MEAGWKPRNLERCGMEIVKATFEIPLDAKLKLAQFKIELRRVGLPVTESELVRVLIENATAAELQKLCKRTGKK